MGEQTNQNNEIVFYDDGDYPMWRSQSKVEVGTTHTPLFHLPSPINACIHPIQDDYGDIILVPWNVSCLVGGGHYYKDHSDSIEIDVTFGIMMITYGDLSLVVHFDNDECTYENLVPPEVIQMLIDLSIEDGV